MNKEIIIKELTDILNEDFSSMKLLGRTSSFRCNKDLFLKLKNKYPNILKSIKHLVEIAKHRNNFDECFGLFYCQCGNEKVIDSKFCSYHNCPAKNKSVGINCKKTKLERYGDANYNNEDKHKQTCLERYGVDNIRKSDKFKEHSKKVKLEKYGDEKFTNREKAKQTCLEKYGKSNYMQTDEFRYKSKKYFQENYNKDYFFETEEFQEKRKETCNEKYQVNSFSKTEEFKSKCKVTWKNNFGVDHPMKSNDIKTKVKNTMNEHWGKHFTKTNLFKDLYKDKEFIRKMKLKELETRTNNNTLQKDLFKNAEHYNKWLNKFKNTMNERYGKSFFTQTQEYKSLYNDKKWVEEKVIKGQNTKRENGTINTSNPEDEIFKLLKNKYSDTIRWYKDSRYPFECDFYIPNKDLFIELNFHWTHGIEPFNKENKQHLNLVNYWFEKSKEIYNDGKHKGQNKEYYTKAIYVWTELDTLKLKTFKDNNLNYKIFYNKLEFDKWFKEQ